MSDVVSILDNRVSHWSLEEASGTRVDQEANGNDLTDVNTVGQATGIQGNAASFTAANNELLEILAGDQTGLSIAGDISISFWFYCDSLPSSGAEMWVANKYKGSAPRTGYGFGIRNVGGNIHLVARAATSNNQYAQIESTSSGITTGTWYYATICIDVSANAAQFYLNGFDWGNPTFSNNNLNGGIAVGDNPLRIGGQPATTSETWDGELDEITITSDIITSGEHASLYNSGSGVPYSGGGGGGPAIIAARRAIFFGI